MSADVVEAEYEESETGRDLAVRQPISLVPQTTAAELVQRLDVIRGAMTEAMQKDVDYGVIPGTGKKPTLLKPGAEKLAVLFQLDVQLENEKLWHDDGHLTVVCRATVFHIPTGARVASGEGICTTREAKYAFRQSERVCPTCGVPAIIKGKAEYGGGWVCFKRKGGCGAKYGENDKAITEQATGQVPNPNIADTYNTVDKMASKRARVDAVLAATGASALFTQDVEDAAPSQSATEEDHRSFPPADDEPPPEMPNKDTLTKLNILVTKLHAAGHLKKEDLWRAHFLDPANGLGEDGEVHWSPLRDRLTKDQASALIERLTKLEARVAAEPMDFEARAAEAQARRNDLS